MKINNAMIKEEIVQFQPFLELSKNVGPTVIAACKSIGWNCEKEGDAYLFYYDRPDRWGDGIETHGWAVPEKAVIKYVVQKRGNIDPDDLTSWVQDNGQYFGT